MLRWTAAFVIATSIIAVTGCGGGDGAARLVPVAGAETPLFGYLTSVTVADDGSPKSVTVQPDSGSEVTFHVQLDEDAFVSGEHLLEHVKQRLPVLIYFSWNGDRRVAYRIDDGGRGAR